MDLDSIELHALNNTRWYYGTKWEGIHHHGLFEMTAQLMLMNVFFLLLLVWLDG